MGFLLGCLAGALIFGMAQVFCFYVMRAIIRYFGRSEKRK